MKKLRMTRMFFQPSVFYKRLSYITLIYNYKAAAIRAYFRKIFFVNFQNFSKGIISGAVVHWLQLLHNFIQLSLSAGSAQIKILLVACWRFSMVRISDNGPG